MNPEITKVPTNEEIAKIHAAYKALTGIEAELTMSVRFVWEAFLVRYSEPDLACVVRYLRQRIKEKRREVESLGMRNLVSNLDYFAETLSMARAESRNSIKESPRQEILRAVGRPEKPKEQCKPIAEVLADLQNWKRENGML